MRLSAAIERYTDARAIIIGYGFFAPGGCWKSIYNYHAFMHLRGENVVLIARKSPGSLRRLVLAFLVGRRVIINGLDAFFHIEALLFCLLCKRRVILYLHETEFVFEAFRRGHPICFRLLRRILSKHRIACVSRQQEAYLKETFGARDTAVLYENIPTASAPTFDAAALHIVMVGTVERRKGASLFSKVAERARELGLPWCFHWIGGPGYTGDVYLSPLVQWHGHQANVQQFLQRADVFFLSSIDDPFPLSCLEALSLFKKCVVYNKSGIAEILSGINGCAVYRQHTVESAMAALRQAISSPLDRERILQINQEVSTVEAFTNRLNRFLEQSIAL